MISVLVLGPDLMDIALHFHKYILVKKVVSFIMSAAFWLVLQIIILFNFAVVCNVNYSVTVLTETRHLHHHVRFT